MNICTRTLLSLAMLALLATPVLAEDPNSVRVSYLKLDQGGAAAAASDKAGAGQQGHDEQLAARTADFNKFAQKKIADMNRNMAHSRDRMQVRKEADGTYRATFHEIDAASFACEVSRSQSKSIPYVAVLTYREQIFTASGQTPEQCRKGPFNPVGFIPNRHIFSYSKGAWN